MDTRKHQRLLPVFPYNEENSGVTLTILLVVGLQPGAKEVLIYLVDVVNSRIDLLPAFNLCLAGDSFCIAENDLVNPVPGFVEAHGHSSMEIVEDDHRGQVIP